MKVKIVKAMRWVHTENGQQVSIHGAHPWGCPHDKKYWELRQVGFTTYNIRENTYGFGKPPFATRESIGAFLKAHPDQFEIVEG